MIKKPIDKLYGLSAILIPVLLMAKYLDLFPVSNWMLGGALILGAVTFFLEAIKQSRKFSLFRKIPSQALEAISKQALPLDLRVNLLDSM